MRGIILAAGRGSRMKEATRSKPKALVCVRGKPLIKYQIEALQSAAISEIAIVTGYMSEKFDCFPNTKFHNPDWMQTNMAYSLTLAASWLRQGPCIVSYSDIFYGTDILSRLIASPKTIAVGFDPNWHELWSSRFKNVLDDAETFSVDDRNMLIDIGQKANSISEIHGQYMGLIKLEPSGWNKIEELTRTKLAQSIRNCHLTDVLQALVKLRTDIEAVPNIEEWGEVDSMDDLNFYNTN